MNQTKTNFVPFGNIPNEIYLDALVDDHSGLTLYFRVNKKKHFIKVFFDTYLTYRNSDESERFKALNQYFPKVTEGALFKTTSSDFIDWIIEESQGIRSRDSLNHYLFVTPNDIVEIISWEDPIIEKFDKSKKIHLNLE